MMEFEACIRQKINIVGVIGNDAAWMQILRGQEQMYGPDRTPALRQLVWSCHRHYPKADWTDAKAQPQHDTSDSCFFVIAWHNT